MNQKTNLSDPKSFNILRGKSKSAALCDQISQVACEVKEMKESGRSRRFSTSRTAFAASTQRSHAKWVIQAGAVLLLLAVAFSGVGCGDSGSDSYWPLNGSSQWDTKGWMVNDEHGASTWEHNGHLACKGTYDNEQGTWNIVQVNESSDYGTSPYMYVFLRLENDKIEMLGISPSTFSGKEAEIIEPSNGVLSFDLSQEAVGKIQNSQFQVDDGYSAVTIDLQVSVKSRGESFSNASGGFDDVLELDVKIHSDNGYGSEDQLVQIWLAKDYGPIRAIKTMYAVTTGGDFVRK